MNEMSEKKKGWADVDGFEKGQEQAKMDAETQMTEEQMKEFEEFRMAIDTAPLAMLEVLKWVLAELRLANRLAFGQCATPSVIFQDLLGVAVENEPVDAPAPVEVEEHPEMVVHEHLIEQQEKEEKAAAEEKADLTVPENLKGEEQVSKYYLNRFREIATRQGEKHPEDSLAKFQFMFQESDVKLRTPSLPTPLFAATARFVEDVLGGKYIGGKGAHFLLPYP